MGETLTQLLYLGPNGLLKTSILSGRLKRFFTYLHKNASDDTKCVGALFAFSFTTMSCPTRLPTLSKWCAWSPYL